MCSCGLCLYLIVSISCLSFLVQSPHLCCGKVHVSVQSPQRCRGKVHVSLQSPQRYCGKVPVSVEPPQRCCGKVPVSVEPPQRCCGKVPVSVQPSQGTAIVPRLLSNAGDTLCIPRLSGECTTGVIQHITSLATGKLSVEQAKPETYREVCLPVLRSTFKCLLVLWLAYRRFNTNMHDSIFMHEM